jgi:hypothetical protein
MQFDIGMLFVRLNNTTQQNRKKTHMKWIGATICQDIETGRGVERVRHFSGLTGVKQFTVHPAMERACSRLICGVIRKFRRNG